MKSKPLLEFVDVTLRSTDGLVFPSTNWTFARNQNWAIVGRNGSGKTLLARAVAGEVPVVKGEIHYYLQPPAGRISEDCIRMVSFEQQRAVAGDAPDAIRWFSLEQDAATSVREFLSQNSVEEINPFEVDAHREQTPQSFRRLRESILRLLQIKPLWDHSLPSLSNGEMRKVLLARALLRKPQLLILDDVFAGLDGKYRSHLKQILERLMRSKSIRILLLNARVQELPRGMTHLLWVDRCRVAAQGPLKRMLQNPIVRRMLLPSASSEKNVKRQLPARKVNRDSEELVRLEGASVQYDGREILSDINWIIRRGESWALTGPNGSGKSTLLSLINGDNPQVYANTVYLFGRRRGSGESLQTLRKRIGRISPELHLHFPESQSCLETAISGFQDATGCYRRPTSQQRAAALKMLHYFGLRPVANSSFGSLSAGSQRTVLLARALVKSPDLLLLDEPCQGLDFAHRAIFLNKIEALLRHEKTTVIYVTHRAEEIPRGIQRILRLQDGRIVESGRMPKR
jgi:molybdate transport system ATP-binding protein